MFRNFFVYITNSPTYRSSFLRFIFFVCLLDRLFVRASHQRNQSLVQESNCPDNEKSETVQQPEQSGKNCHDDLHGGHRFGFCDHFRNVGRWEKHEESNNVLFDFSYLLFERGNYASEMNNCFPLHMISGNFLIWWLQVAFIFFFFYCTNVFKDLRSILSSIKLTEKINLSLWGHS